MAQNSKIEWCDHTANLWWGCTKVNEGCDHCYAETLSKRWGEDIWGNNKPRRAIKSVWKDLNKYQKMAKEARKISRVFVGSMMDIFEKPMSIVDSKGELIKLDGMDEYGMTTNDMRAQLFINISNNIYPNLLFLFLTKRPSNINKYIPESWKENPPKNVMFGTSLVNQETANKLIPQLLQVNGKRFLSVEPQLGTLDLCEYLGIWCNQTTGKWVNFKSSSIDWVIQGGESGHHRRPFNLNWAYSLKRQCESANVPYFFKQIDKVLPIPEDLMVRQFPILNQKTLNK